MGIEIYEQILDRIEQEEPNISPLMKALETRLRIIEPFILFKNAIRREDFSNYTVKFSNNLFLINVAELYRSGKLSKKEAYAKIDEERKLAEKYLLERGVDYKIERNATRKFLSRKVEIETNSNALEKAKEFLKKLT